MNWRDLLYFSKGERRALTLLLCLISIALILLIIKDAHEINEPIEEPQYIVHPENAPILIPVDTTTNSSIEPKQKIPASIPRKKEITGKRKTYSSFPKTEKYSSGTIVEINTADTTILKKVPGIGSTFARRIVKYRELLGGFYSVTQLREVYGIDEERYQSLHTWFHADPAFIARLQVNYLSMDSLVKHPYLNYKQAKIIYQLRKQKGRLSGWENLHLLDEFNDYDKERLKAYLVF